MARKVSASAGLVILEPTSRGAPSIKRGLESLSLQPSGRTFLRQPTLAVGDAIRVRRSGRRPRATELKVDDRRVHGLT